ncbi:hypothetical protein ACFPK1_12565 [Actinomycetospora rhizophila]|uniref:Uncharacterized protein n=1 Tax=Actinomycetospora rhizophila TaxID=1416876 RepID=A0ABV9ZFV6_9PSEU
MVGRTEPGARWYIALATSLVVGAAAAAIVLYSGKDFADRGPLSYPSPGAVVAEDARVIPPAVDRCFPVRPPVPFRYVAVTAEVLGRQVAACYTVGVGSGNVQLVSVIDAAGVGVRDPAVLKAAGVWPSIAVVTTARGLVLGVLTVAVIVALGWVYYRSPRPGPPVLPAGARRSWWHGRGAGWLLVLLPVASWIPFSVTSSITPARKIRIVFQASFVVTAVFVAVQLTTAAPLGDSWGLAIFGSALGALVLCSLGGSFWLTPADFDHPDRRPAAAPRRRPARLTVGWQTTARSRSRAHHTVDRPPPHRTSAHPRPLPSSPVEDRISRWRAAAKPRLNLGRLLRLVATVLAVFLAATAMIGLGVGLGVRLDPLVRIVLLLLFLPWMYLWFFVFPGCVTAVLAAPLIIGWRAPARILVLRPFGRPDHSRPLRGLVRREVAGYGHTYTLADVAISVRWYIAIPVVLGQLAMLSFRQRRLRTPADLDDFVLTMTHRRRRNLNWAVARSKVFPVRCTDELWRVAVLRMIAASDVVLFDATHLSGNLIWEIDALRRLRRLQDCVFLSYHGDEARTAAALGCHGIRVRLLGFDGAGRLVDPQGFRHALAAILARTTEPVGPAMRARTP